MGKNSIPLQNTPNEDMGAWIELLNSMQTQLSDLTEQQGKLIEENKLLNNRIVEASTAATLNKQVSSTAGIAGSHALMPLSRINDFLNSRRPDTEFFTLKNPYYKFQLDAGKEAPFDPQQNRQTGRPIPGFWLVMNFWFGPGCELKKGDGAQKYKIGQCDLTTDRLLNITKEDIEKYHLADTLEPRSDGVYNISVLLARIFADDDYKLGRLLTGEQFRLLLQAEYETLWSTQQNQERLSQRLASLRSGAEKTGILADEVVNKLVGGIGPEQTKSGSNIIEPVMAQ